MKFKKKLICLINISLIAMSVNATASTNTWRDQEQDCQWSKQGCSTADNALDLRSRERKMIDNLSECQNTIQGCNIRQIQAIEELQGKRATLSLSDVSGVSITGDDLLHLISKNSSDNPKFKSYYVPLNLTKGELLTFAATTSLGLVVFHNDQEIMDFVQETKTEKTEPIADIGNIFGREIVAPLVIGSYFLGVVFENGELKDVGLITVSAGIATALITEGFKKTFSRVRPNSHEGPYEFGKKGNNSFFSGHTSAAFSMATVIAETFKEDHKWVPYVAYGAAALTAYARMHDEKHWASDVLVGAIVGHYVTKIVYRMHKDDEKSKFGLSIYPSYNPVNGDFSIEVKFTGKQAESQFKCAKIAQGPKRTAACIEEVFERAK